MKLWKISLTAGALAVCLILPGVAGAQEQPASDTDRDGIADRQDACPQTPAGLRPLARGCAAIELVRAPETLLAPVLAGLDERQTALAANDAFAGGARYLEAGRSDIGAAADQLRQGDVCRAAELYTAAQSELGKGAETISGDVESAAAGLLRERSSRQEDVDDAELRVAWLRLQDTLTAASVKAAAEPGDTLRRLCDAVVGGLEAGGVVSATDDAAGTVQLEDGSIYALAATAFRDPLSEGTEVRLSGIAFADGSGVVTGYEVPPPPGPPGPPGPDPSADCLALRIAPIQGFKPFGAAPYTLLDPLGYATPNFSLDLEQGMRLAAVDTGCPTSGGFGIFYHWSLKIDATNSVTQQTSTIAVNLKSGDEPVALPVELTKTDPSTMLVVVYRTTCIGKSCGTPQAMGSQVFGFVTRPRGSYATAKYSRTEFTVADNGVAGDFQTAKVTGMTLNLISASNNPQFFARGWKVTNSVSSRPQEQTIAQNQLFAVFEDDLFSPDDIFPWETVGVDHPAGIIWPRVTGTRFGMPFQYSVTLPHIVHDMVNTCDAAPNSFVKLPFHAGFPTWKVGKGNVDDPVNAHGGDQGMAVDFTAPEKTDIFAARGGVVVKLVESESLNIKDYPPGYPGIGNYMWIQHEDGTWGIYFHMVQNGILVNMGGRVHRGDHIALVGNTGSSSEPHLHFQTTKSCGPPECDPSWPFNSIRLRYPAFVGTGKPVSWNLDNCHIPRVGDKLISTQ
jgi:murein DD-endopeptidase MepM/ murein hydrolase activator NlpD